MPPALRVLVLATTILCIFLLFSTFFLDGILNKKYITLKKEFGPNYRTFSNKNKTLSEGTSTPDSVDASSTLKLLPVYDFVESANYNGQDASSAGVVDQGSLERLGGNYYRDRNAVYYLISKGERCGDSFIDKAIKLPVDLETLMPVAKGNVLKDSKNVFVYFRTVQGADPLSFSYTGLITHEAKTQSHETQYWFKDKNKVYVITRTHDDCSSGSLSDDGGTLYKDADPLTFEYLGGDINSTENAYAKDKNYFYNDKGILSATVTPMTCVGNFFSVCLPQMRTPVLTSSGIQ